MSKGAKMFLIRPVDFVSIFELFLKTLRVFQVIQTHLLNLVIQTYLLSLLAFQCEIGK